MNIKRSAIYTGPEALQDLNNLLGQEEVFGNSDFFILVDEQTLQFCLPLLLAHVPVLKNAEIFEIESGEENKGIELCTQLWEALSEHGADRQSLLVNLGGGVITDMGGFIASCYMRGISFINVPTTLLAQVDAALGGKTGVDLGNLKNQVGVFNDPMAVCISSEFLKTLSKRQLMAGFAEMLKHGLIADRPYWDKLKQIDFSNIENLTDPVIGSISIKKEIVESDPTEQGLRKALNFGHTVGHAIESFSMESQQRDLLHGEAVAIGMICEAFLSAEHGKLSKEALEEITDVLLGYYAPYPIEEINYNRIVEIMKHDKKNVGGELNFTFLTEIGTCQVNCIASPSNVMAALIYYRVMANQKV